MSRIVPAITLWQPWASLIFTGHKRHETRSFPLPDRLVEQDVAIQAAARSVRPSELDPDLDVRIRAYWGDSYDTAFTHRAILGLVRFGAALPTETAEPFDDYDRSAGDWKPGRWAWPIVWREQFDEPIPATGRQGWFKVEVP